MVEEAEQTSDERLLSNPTSSGCQAWIGRRIRFRQGFVQVGQRLDAFFPSPRNETRRRRFTWSLPQIAEPFVMIDLALSAGVFSKTSGQRRRLHAGNQPCDCCRR